MFNCVEVCIRDGLNVLPSTNGLLIIYLSWVGYRCFQDKLSGRGSDEQTRWIWMSGVFSRA